MERYILHVDVNNAFLSWTAVDMLSKGEKIDIRQIPSRKDRYTSNTIYNRWR